MRLTIAIFILALIGCKPEPQHKLDAPVFDLPGFVDGLILNMDSKNHSVTKTFTLNSDTETKQYDSSDSIFWARELAILKDIDLNSPQLRDVISINNNLKDENSNLLIDEYLVADDNTALFKKLSVYYLKESSEIRQVYAELTSDNLISKSSTKFNLWINRYNNKLIIDSLQIIGYDKTFMQPEREYHIITRTTR